MSPLINIKDLKYHKKIGTHSNGYPIYAPGVKFGCTATMQIDKTGESESYYCDGKVNVRLTAGSGYTLGLTLGKLNDEFALDCLGVIKDLNGVFIESEEGQKSDFALTGIIDEALEGSLINPFKFAYYSCSAGNPSQTATTKTESTTFGETTIELTTTSIPVGNKNVQRAIIYKYADITNDVLDTNYDTWDDSVYIPETEDTAKPTINLVDPNAVGYTVNISEKTVTVAQGSTLVPLTNFVEAKDYNDVVLTNIQVQGEIDVENVGSYIIIYIVKDSNRKYSNLEVIFNVI